MPIGLNCAQSAANGQQGGQRAARRTFALESPRRNRGLDGFAAKLLQQHAGASRKVSCQTEQAGALGAPACEDSFQDVYAISLRRSAPASPRIPLPNSAIVPGSGTVCRAVVDWIIDPLQLPPVLQPLLSETVISSLLAPIKIHVPKAGLITTLGRFSAPRKEPTVP